MTPPPPPPSPPPPRPVERELRIGRARGPNRTLRLAVVLAALLVILLPAVATRLTDWLWYRDIGFERVFLTKIIAQWTLALMAGIGGFAILYLNARIALRGVATRNLHIRDANTWAA